MGRLVGAGIIKEKDSNEIVALKQVISKKDDEIALLISEKEDLEKVSKELASKVKKLEEKLSKSNSNKEKNKDNKKADDNKSNKKNTN